MQIQHPKRRKFLTWEKGKCSKVDSNLRPQATGMKPPHLNNTHNTYLHDKNIPSVYKQTEHALNK